MDIRTLILWQPRLAGRGFLHGLFVVLALLLALLHYRTGLAYEFHVLFSLPVLAAGWFLGFRSGLALAVLVTGLWLLTDNLLGASAIFSLPGLFNTCMRLAIFAGEAWLLGQMRTALDCEIRLAREDGLTGLPNRRAFHERSALVLAQAFRNPMPVTAVFIDLDGFKQVNDSRGHEAGDVLLACVAATLRQHLRAGDVAGRLGGDEFAMLMPGMDASAAAGYVESLRDRLLEAMRARDWPVTFSIGVACCRTAPPRLERLLAVADGLMYEAKHGGKNRILQQVFDDLP